ncbi:MAG: TolC family protein [Paracoccaceae bacterium]
MHMAHAASLGDAVFSAMLNSSSRKAAMASIEAQSNMIAIAQSDRRPQVDVFGEAALERVDNPSSLSVADNNDTKLGAVVGIDVTFNMLDGMRTTNSIYREATLLDAEIIRLSDATETLALNAVQAYIDVVRHRQIVAASHDNVHQHQRIVGQVNEQVRAGKLSDADRFRANDKLLAAKLAKSEADGQLADAVSQYHAIIGLAPKGKMSISGRLKLPKSSAALEKTAVTNSFQLQLAQTDIQAQDYQGKIDQSQWKPRLDAFVGASVGEDRDGSSGSESEVAAGLRLNWTVYKGGAKKATEARNHDLQMRAHYRKKQVENEVRDFARRVWNSYSAAHKRKHLLDQSVSTNVRIVSAFRQEFEAAKRPLLQVLDAERALFNIKIRRINANAAVAYQGYRMLAAQNTLSDHFGLARSGSALAPDYERRAKAQPMGDFDISAPPLD